MTAWIELVIAVCYQISNKSFITLTEDGIKHVVILLEDHVIYLSLQSRLELFEHLGFMDDGIIILKLVVEKQSSHV